MSNNLINREKWLKKTLKRIPRGKKILDAGAGELQYKKYCSHLKYTSQDFAEYTGSNIQEGLQTGSWDNSKLDIISDITQIPVKDQSFDAIMCIEVFEHISEPSRAVTEFQRILRRGGKLIVTAPFCSLTHFAPYYYSSGYSKFWYKKVLTENGFRVLEITPNGNYFDYLAQEMERLVSVADSYGELTAIYRRLLALFTKIMTRFLVHISRKSKRSEELLTFGIHIVAVKN